MNIKLLALKLNKIKQMYENAISTGQFIDSKGNLKTFTSGSKAKTSLTRSGKLIQNLHQVVKLSIKKDLRKNSLINSNFSIHPPLGKEKPEKETFGHLKSKKQDILVLFDSPNNEIISQGALKGQMDKVGFDNTQKAIIIGVRSQLSSIDKNFDTLMERAYAEALNTRLRTPKTIMGEVFLIPVNEYEEKTMKNKIVSFSPNKTKIEKYLSIFKEISNRKNFTKKLDYYKYERTCVLIVDFQQNPIKIYETKQELIQDGLISTDCKIDYSKLSPKNFSKDIVTIYNSRH